MIEQTEGIRSLKMVGRGGKDDGSGFSGKRDIGKMSDEFTLPLKINPLRGMRKTIWLYGLLAAMLIFAVRFFEQRSLTGQLPLKTYAALVGVVFLVLGIWVGWKFFKSPAGNLPDSTPHTLSSFSTSSTSSLTEREAEILACIAEGLSNRDIAARLFVSENTVKKHVQNIFAKLEVGNRVHALAKARALGWLA